MTKLTASLSKESAYYNFVRESDAFSANVLLQLLNQRVAVKNFKRGVPLPVADLEKILNLSSLVPSAFNLQPWHVINVSSTFLRKEVWKMAWQQPQVIDASALLAIGVDTKPWLREKIRGSYAETDEDESRYRNMLEKLYGSNEKYARDEAMRSASIFSMGLILAAESLGYQTCPMSGFDYSKVSDVLGLGGDIELCMLIAVGTTEGKVEVNQKSRVPAAEFFQTL